MRAPRHNITRCVSGQRGSHPYAISLYTRICRGMLLLLCMQLVSTFATAQTSKEKYQQDLLEIQQHIQQGDLDGARLLAQKALRLFPLNGGLENLLGVIEVQQGHLDLARQQFSNAIQHEPSLAGAYLNLGRLDMQTAANDKAARSTATGTYEKLLRREPANPEANYQLATLLMWDQKYQASLLHMKRLAPTDLDSIGAQIVLCADEAALGHKEQANEAAAKITAASDLQEQDAMDVLPALRIAHRADLIEQIFAAANTLHPLSPGGLRTLGLAQEANGKLPQARATMESAFAAAPDASIVLVDLARIAKAQKDYQGALGYLAHARELSPSDATLPYEFGVICVRLGLLGEASKALAEAVKLAPENADDNFAMGTISSFAQDPTQGKPYLEKAHALRPNDPAPVLAMGTMYFRAKNFEDARKWLTEAAANAATAADAHFYLGRIARQEGHLDEAERELAQANTLHPDNPDVLAELGQVATATRNYPAAQRYLDQAIALDKDHYAANFALLQLYARTSDPRREAQSARFDAIRDQSQEQYKEAMRIIEVRPDAPPAN